MSAGGWEGTRIQSVGGWGTGTRPRLVILQGQKLIAEASTFLAVMQSEWVRGPADPEKMHVISAVPAGIDICPILRAAAFSWSAMALHDAPEEVVRRILHVEADCGLDDAIANAGPR